MGSTFNPNQTYSGTGSTTAPTSTVPGTTASTATTGSTTTPAALTPQQVSQFMAAYSISSTDQAAYINGGQLTPLGQTLEWYGSLDQTDRQQAQTTLVALGYLPETDATGESNSTSLGALKTMLTQGHLSDFQTALSNPETGVQAQISTNLAAASKEAQAASSTPIVADLTDTNALNQGLSKAFEDALGYQPSAEQMNTFVSSFHAAQKNEASGTKDAEQQAATQEETQAKAQESALSKLGPDGLDAFLSAYANAIHGIVPAGGNPNAPQGPVTASNPNSSYLTPGTKLPPDTTAGFNSSGTEMLANTLPTQKTTTEQVPPGPLQQLGHAASTFNPLSSSGLFSNSNPLETPYTSKTMTTNVPTPGMATASNLPPGLPGTTPSYGGIYVLTPALWKQAQQALGKTTPLGKQAAAAATAGAASKTVQAAAVGALAQQLFDSNGGSWSDVAITLAGGNPQTPSKGHVLNTSTNVQNFATGVANNVNSQIEAINNQVNNQQAPVIGKEAPNPAADELAAAESADPNQYIAHNMSLAEGTLQKMLYGTPQIEAQSDSNLAGDVAQVSASNSAAA